MKRKNIIAICLTVLVCLAFSSKAQTPKDRINEYYLKFGGIKDRTVTVNANIHMEGDELRMIERPVRFIPDIESWWDLITINKMEDVKGNSIKIDKTSGDIARLNRKVDGQLKIIYTIDITYVDRNYPNQNTAIGKSFEEGLFMVGKPLFIFGNWKLPTKVHISKPNGIKITVPWQKEGAVFSAATLRELVLSNIIISTNTMGVVDFTTGNFSYSLATFALGEKSIELVKQIAKDVSDYYVETFPFNHDIRYVQLVYGIPGANGGGEAYPNSSASAISKRNMEGSFFWRITIFHELFHMWNSHMLKGVSESSDMEWFQEGFTDYMTEVALLKTGHIDINALTNFQRNRLKALKRRFENNTEKISIENSGANKGKNYVIVYRGGWLIAEWLDRRLKPQADNQWSVEQLFRHLFAKYPQQGDKVLNLDAFLAEVESIDQNIAIDLKAMLNCTDWATLSTYLIDK